MVSIKKKEESRPSGKFGSKYGKMVRQRFDEADKKAKEKYKCPSCKRESLKKEGTGIWKCTKCGTKVSGGAYSPKTGADKILKKALRKSIEVENEAQT